MGFWPASVNTANLERIGPWFDLYVGTDGRVSDLYAAYVTHGARRIVLCGGATLSADLTIAASDVFIWSPFHPRGLNLGAKKITITGTRVHLAGFKISGATGVGIEINSSGETWLERIAVENCGSHGIHLNGGQNDANFERLYLLSNGGDGIRLTTGNHANIGRSLIYGNTGYGVNDATNSSILVGNRIANNTAGNINGTPSVNTGNKVT